MVFDVNAASDNRGDRRDQSTNLTEVSVFSFHDKSVIGTAAVLIGIAAIAILVWYYHRKKVNKHRKRCVVAQQQLALTYQPNIDVEEQNYYSSPGLGGPPPTNKYRHNQQQTSPAAAGILKKY